MDPSNFFQPDSKDVAAQVHSALYNVYKPQATLQRPALSSICKVSERLKLHFFSDRRADDHIVERFTLHSVKR